MPFIKSFLAHSKNITNAYEIFVLNKLLGKRFPFFVSWALTYGCNRNCLYCGTTEVSICNGYTFSVGCSVSIIWWNFSNDVKGEDLNTYNIIQG